MENSFARIYGDSEKMKKYNANPFVKASFMALWAYTKTGYKIEDLPWFSLSQKNNSNQYTKVA